MPPTENPNAPNRLNTGAPVTRQKEVENETKKIEAQLANMKSEHIRVAEEERRKTLGEETKHAHSRAEYQDQLARKRNEEELAMKARMQKESLRKQEESVKKQELLRKQTIEHELALKHKYELEKIEAETKARAKAARENRGVNLEQMKLHEEENRKTVIEKIKTSGELIGSGINQFLSDKTKIAAAVGGLTALAVGWYTAKRGTGLTARYIGARLGKSSLVRETSRITPLEVAKHPIKTFQMMTRQKKDPLAGVILSPALERRLRDIAITTSNTKRNNGLFRNVMLYGPPGAGKKKPVLLQKGTHELRCLREYLMLALEAIMHNHREMMVNYVKTVREQPRQIPQSSIDSAMERANT
ncbi:hypothetical protein CAEBREN_15674 [Caenorhabditis brenneri]|uniref:ATPase family AAA domain-containing protein n=1 Tax=Caenorhabditis brenneri TaxID=135651 RepID=G0NXK2_CAEBE|nr:hypothetical protein CAEBREN_15674 [Caenorhabditis brenneri]